VIWLFASALTNIDQLPATFLGEGGHLHHLQRTADEKGAGGALDACQKRFTQMLESEAAKERAELKDAVKNPAAYAAKRADQAADRIVASLDRILPVVRGVAETLKHVEKKLDNNALATRLPAPVARLVACAGASRPSSNVLPRSEAAATSCAQPQSSARPANCCTISLPVNPALEKAASERSAAYAELKRTEKAKKAKRIADAALEKEVQSQETSKEPDIEAEVTEQLHPSK